MCPIGRILCLIGKVLKTIFYDKLVKTSLLVSVIILGFIKFNHYMIGRMITWDEFTAMTIHRSRLLRERDKERNK